jgi:hypothetical protein
MEYSRHGCTPMFLSYSWAYCPPGLVPPNSHDGQPLPPYAYNPTPVGGRRLWEVIGRWGEPHQRRARGRPLIGSPCPRRPLHANDGRRPGGTPQQRPIDSHGVVLEQPGAVPLNDHQSKINKVSMSGICPVDNETYLSIRQKITFSSPSKITPIHIHPSPWQVSPL